MKRSGIRVKVAVSLVILWAISVTSCVSGPGTGNGNVASGPYKIYASNGEVEWEGDTTDLGYYPEIYAAEAGFVYIGTFTGTQTIELPNDTINILIHSPTGTCTNIDAVEFQDQQSNLLGYIGYDAEGNYVGFYVNSGNLGCSGDFEKILGSPDGIYAVLGKTCDPLSYTQRGYILTARTGYVGDTGTFQKVVIYVIASPPV